MAMASTIEHETDIPVKDGCVVVPFGYPETLPFPYKSPKKINVLEAAHPVPDDTSEEAAHVLLELADMCQANDLLLVLVSGGGSSLTTHFADGITVEEGQKVVHQLLRAGADISSLNTVRKHISMMGGGRLVKRALPAEIVTLVISDVYGDDLSIIASGPTVGDVSRPEDAVRVLRNYELWEKVPAAVTNYLTNAVEDEALNTPDPSDAAYIDIVNKIIGTNKVALDAACREAVSRSYEATIMDEWIEGEARSAGTQVARYLKNYAGKKPHCFIWGGETTVTVKGKGIGGRNQEFVLAAALELDGAKDSILILSAGTDGIDGPTDAAGAWATPSTIPRARQRKRDPRAYLEANDAYTFFLEMNTLLKPGPTHTNVMDIIIGLVL